MPPKMASSIGESAFGRSPRLVWSKIVPSPFPARPGLPSRAGENRIRCCLVVGLPLRLEPFNYEDFELATTKYPMGGSAMAWTSPKVVEICVGLEINSYACAEV